MTMKSTEQVCQALKISRSYLSLIVKAMGLEPERRIIKGVAHNFYDHSQSSAIRRFVGRR